MKSIPSSGVVALLGSLLLGQATPPPSPIAASLSSRWLWDHSGKDTTGNPETLAAGELAFFAAGATPATATPLQRIATPAQAPALGFDATPALSKLSNGNYVAAVRVRDAAGNWSAWSAPASVVIDNAAPEPPVNVRLSITIEIGGPQ